MSHKEISRRQLLKVMIASGGAVITASMLPGRWMKPFVSTGVLPAHAQTSFQPTAVPEVVRTFTAGTITAGSWLSFSFSEGPITSAEYNAAPFTKMRIAWNSGVATTDVIDGDFILSSGYSDAFTTIPSGANSPVEMDMPTGISGSIDQVEFILNAGADPWNAGTITITFFIP